MSLLEVARVCHADVEKYVFSPVVPAYWRNLGTIPEHMLSLLRLYLVKAAGNFLTVKWKSHSANGNA